MAGFYYFFPGIEAGELVRGNLINRELLKERGLIEILDDLREVPKHATVTPSPQGPGGLSGVILYPKPTTGEVPTIIGYHSQAQAWQACGDGKQRWIGWLKDAPPQPFELERAAGVATWWTAPDGNGRRWSIPSLRGHSNSSSQYGSLPASFVFGADGSPSMAINPEYQTLWNQSESVWDHLQGGVQLDDNTLACFAAEVISLAYRIGPDELNALHAAGCPLITTANLRSLLLCICDYDVMAEYDAAQKKIESQAAPDGSDSLTGTTEETQAGKSAEASSI